MERYCILYKNNGDETFTELNVGFPGVSHGSLEWADFDGDTDLDLFICGTETTPGEGNYISSIYLNNGDDTFTESATAQLPGVHWGDSKVADYNNDGNPDILLSGIDINETPYTAIFKNEQQSMEYTVTFRVDMSNETVSPNGIHITGTFQGWDPGATLMTDAGNAIYEYTQNLNEGEVIEYKFVNGTQWGEDESVPPECAQNNNRYFTVPAQDTVLVAVCFGSCDPCGDMVNITFRVDMSEQTVSTDGVHVAGSFQGWDPIATEMTDIGNNIYSVTYTVISNVQVQYKFINGIDWDVSEIVPEECGIPDGFGAFNRFLNSPLNDSTLMNVCFSSCVPCVTGINEKEIGISKIIGIYPNPFTNKLYVEYYLAEQAKTEIGIYNSFGKKVNIASKSSHEAGMHTENISLSHLAKGVYFVIIKVDDVIIQTQTIIK